MNLPNPTAPKQEITVTLMLEPQASGGFVASAVEFPAVRVEAATEAAAIAELQQALGAHVAHAKIMPWVMPVSPIEAAIDPPAWAKFAGIFRDNPMFDEVMASIQADRDAWGDEPMDVSEYQR
jgi:predicted RNase H-like HicB family nuclease